MYHNFLKMRKSLLFMAAFTALLSFFASCNPSGQYHRSQGMIWNTMWQLTYKGPEKLADSVPIILSEIGKSVSVFDESSICSMVNLHDSVKTDIHFRNVYQMSLKINRISEGMFDPTLGPLIDIWGFGRNHTVSRDTAAIDSVLKFVGITKTHLSGDRLVKENNNISFNFSAIAKGYGCDAVAEMLKRNGVDDFLIEIGGEIYASGQSPKGRKWNISIDRPVLNADPGEESECIISISNCGVATSGNYRNFHSDSENGRFGHTINPHSGRPAITDILSATVIAPTAMEADALATALLASGSSVAIKITERHNLAVMLVLADSSQWKSKKFATFLCEEPASANRN